MRIIRARSYTGDRPWASLDLERFDKASVRLHWTDAPYIWHVNDGPEIFAVLDGVVDMRVKTPAGETVHRLAAGDVAHMEVGDEHVAEPVGEARILVIERPGSV